MILRHDGHLGVQSVVAHKTIEYRRGGRERTGNQDSRALVAQDMLDGIVIRPGFKLMQLIPTKLVCIEQSPLLLPDALRDRPTFDLPSDSQERVFQESSFLYLFLSNSLGQMDFSLISLRTAFGLVFERLQVPGRSFWGTTS